ncbi:hypothetical protein GR183_12000 [Stappia sp. GBMRC 2046]|uniref:Uncharacterized protein n=1 Tax=Stappia sediminis TaxID=2692190 RepID=A0A7X3S8B0_9HYPH|nr:DUF6030 family protein [Stappia sediminis]MXN65627.1 hypothetical protein [Stappia sediminis]
MRSDETSDETANPAKIAKAVNRVRLTAVAAALVAAVAGTASIGWWFLREDGAVEPQTSALEEDRAPQAADPLGGLPEDTRSRLTDPVPDRPDLFKLVYGGHPRDLCSAFNRVGVPMSAWTPDPLKEGGWQCSSDLIAVGEENGEAKQSTIFVNLRGGAEDRLDFLRIKMNGDNPDTLGEIKAATRDVLDQVAGRYGWEWPQSLYDAISRAGSAEMSIRGAEIKVRRERSDLVNDGTDVVRLNVVIDFPDGAGSARGDDFSPFEWEKGGEWEKCGRETPKE